MDQDKEREARAIIERFLQTSLRVERAAKLKLPAKFLEQISEQAKIAADAFEKLLQDARETKESMAAVQGVVEEIKEKIENDDFVGDILTNQRVHIYQEFLYEIFAELTQREPRILDEEESVDILGSGGDADIIEAVFSLLAHVRGNFHRTLIKIMSQKRPVRKRKK